MVFHALGIADTGELLPEMEPNFAPYHGTAPCGAPILEVLELAGVNYRKPVLLLSPYDDLGFPLH
jgi:hypothetical protein